MSDSQSLFLQSGGIYREGVSKLPPYSYQEYPKALRLNVRDEDVETIAQDIRGRDIIKTVRKTVWDEVVVHSEDEEARVLAGQKTEADVEDERQAMIVKAEQRGVKVDRRWGIDRIRAEMERGA